MDSDATSSLKRQEIKFPKHLRHTVRLPLRFVHSASLIALKSRLDRECFSLNPIFELDSNGGVITGLFTEVFIALLDPLLAPFAVIDDWKERVSTKVCHYRNLVTEGNFKDALQSVAPPMIKILVFGRYND